MTANSGKKPTSLSAWRKANRQLLQTTSLVVSLLAPFGLFLSVNADQVVLSSVLFAMIAISIFLALWAG